MATIYYEKDADPGLVAGRKVAVMGYGSQGHAHALNLRDSGVDVRVGLREGSSSRAKAEAAGLRVLPIDKAAAEADLVMMLLPDTEQAAVETLVEAGYQPESAYFESLHEVKLIVDLMYEHSISGMRYSISDTVEYGDLTRGPRIVDDHVRQEMRRILEEIRSGRFAEE